MIRLKADCASAVMQSASSRMITLYPTPPYDPLNYHEITKDFDIEQMI